MRILLVAIMLTFLPVQIASACSCMKQDMKLVLDKSKNVVFGKLTNLKAMGDDKMVGDFGAMHVFKGKADHVQHLLGSNKTDGASCNVELKEAYYLVYTNDARDVAINLCSTSQQVEDKDVVDMFNRIKKQTAELAVVPSASKPQQKANEVSSKQAAEKPLWDQFLESIGWE